MRRPSRPVQWLLAAGAAAAATGAGFLLDGHMSAAGLAMVYLVAVAASALTLGRAPGLAAALLCVCALNFFFVPPRYSFEVENAEYWWTLVVLLALSLALNQLIAALGTSRERAEAARAETARNTLLASLSHDLRTPLAAILGTAGALRTQGEHMPAAQRERLLASLEDEARDLTLMADNILQMARLAQPPSALRLEWESLEEVLGAAVARMRRRWPAADIAFEPPPPLPPVRAEAQLLAQLVANLVDNAVRHGGPADAAAHEGAGARIVLRAGHAPGGVYFAVRDFGTGLPADLDPQALFGRFGPSARGGTAGLGLAICRLIADGHGGRIAAHRCEPGAEFRVELPVADHAP